MAVHLAAGYFYYCISQVTLDHRPTALRTRQVVLLRIRRLPSEAQARPGDDPLLRVSWHWHRHGVLYLSSIAVSQMQV